MKKIINIFLASTLVLSASLMASCTGDFEKLNTNPMEVDLSDLPFSAQCATPMNFLYPPQENNFQFWTNLTIDDYGGYFTQPHGMFSNADMGENRGHSNGMYENTFLRIIPYTKNIIATCEANDQPALAGVMRIVQALGVIPTTDAYGPIAYSSVLNPVSDASFTYDSQQQVYTAVIADLQKAITEVNGMTDAEKSILATFDSFCGGDPALWVKMANTMLLRYALRLEKREEEMSAAGVNLKAIASAAASNTLAKGGKDILNTSGQNNMMYRMMTEWDDCAFNANLVTLLQGYNDPRLPLYVGLNDGDMTSSDGTVTPRGTVRTGVRFAADLPHFKPNAWTAASAWVGTLSTPLPIMKQAESYFLLAEAALRGWTSGDIKQFYEDGIKCSINNEVAYKGSYAGIESISAADINAYINGTTPQAAHKDYGNPKYDHAAMNTIGVKWDDSASDEVKLQRIVIQRFLANFPLSNEAWADYRRTGYPIQFPAMVNLSNGAVDTDEMVRRQLYPQKSYNTNLAATNAAIEILNRENSSTKGISGDKGGTHVWWDNAAKGNF